MAAIEPVKRLFFALPCASSERKAIAQWRAGLGLRTGKPVPAENFHLTLLFLGAVKISQIADICAVVSALTAKGQGVSVLLNRLQAWQQARTLCLAPEFEPKALRELVYALEQALLPLGFNRSSMPFKAHLSLAHDYPAEAPEAVVAPAFYLQANHFALYESHKGCYRALAEWPL